MADLLTSVLPPFDCSYMNIPQSCGGRKEKKNKKGEKKNYIQFPLLLSPHPQLLNSYSP